MSWLAHVTVSAVIAHDGRFLLVEEQDAGRTVFNQPAGHLEEDESLLDAVRREVREETCAAFSPAGFTGVYIYRAPHNGVTYCRVNFFGSVSLPIADCARDADIIDTGWYTRAALNDMPLRSPLVLRSIDDYLAGRQLPLEALQHVR